MSSRRVLVAGGRSNYNFEIMVGVFCRYTVEGDIIVHGDAAGADRLCAHIAHTLGLATEAHPADWKRYGKAAGGIRNQEMLDSGIDLALVFAGGYGTRDMLGRLAAAGIRVIRQEGMEI